MTRAISARIALFAPIIGITMVLISVIPAGAGSAGTDGAGMYSNSRCDCRDRAAQRRHHAAT